MAVRSVAKDYKLLMVSSCNVEWVLTCHGESDISYS